MEIIHLWDNVPALDGEEPVLEYYPAKNKTTDATFVIFPGGAYAFRSAFEGDGYARFLNSMGMDAFVCEYRVLPNRFPLQLLDARRAMRYVRANAEKYGIDPNKIGAMGSSAGGHLAALLANYKEKIDYEGVDKLDDVDPVPNSTVLCYPAIRAVNDEDQTVYGCLMNLAGDSPVENYYPDTMVTEQTPPAFIWATYEDACVNIISSYTYGKALRDHNVSHELHILTGGDHGLGLADGIPGVEQWSGLMVSWLKRNGWLAE